MRAAQDFGKGFRQSNRVSVLLIAAGLGLVTGVVCASLRFELKFLQWLITGSSGLLAEAARRLALPRRAMTPIAGGLIVVVINAVSGRLLGRDRFVEYVAAVRFGKGRIPFASTLWKMISSSFSIASGAAIGREGSMIQFALATVSTMSGRWRPQSIALARLVGIGSAGAVAAVYQAPVAGAFFALEIVIGLPVWSRAAWDELPALLISGFVGAQVSGRILDSHSLFPLHVPLAFGWLDAAAILAMAAAIGCCGPVYVRLIRSTKWLKRVPLAVVLSGAVVGGLSCISPEVWGNGDSAVLAALGGSVGIKMALMVLGLRLVATLACVGSGVAGGVFTPTVFAGSALGLVAGYGIAFVSPHAASPTIYAVLGIGCLLAATTQAPFMAWWMTLELTGMAHWPLGVVAVFTCSLLSWQVSSRFTKRSLYTVATPDPGSMATHAHIEAGEEESETVSGRA